MNSDIYKNAFVWIKLHSICIIHHVNQLIDKHEQYEQFVY